MESLLDTLAGAFESLDRKYFGVVTGRVINLLDPLTLGRAQVQLPFLDDLDLSPWCRVATPMAGIAAGCYFIPNIGDEVLVAFAHGNLSEPYILGSLWNATAPPPWPSPLAQIRTIRTPLQNEISFYDLTGTITVKTATAQTIVMSPAGIQITTGANLVNMTADGVTITGPNVNVVGTTAINLTAPTVTINGATATNLQSAGVANITAPLVKIN